VNDELNAEFWRSIALATLQYAPPALRKMWMEFQSVSPEESIRKLREFNDSYTDFLHLRSMNELYYNNSLWRH
jgi:hypothetical protein